MLRKTFICQQCDREFKPHHKDSKYCSYACNNKSRAQSPLPFPIACPVCKKTFKPNRNKPEKYCSLQCYRTAIHENALSNQLYTCKLCDNEYTPSHQSQIYCSLKCRNQGRQLRTEFTCEWCDKKFIDRIALNRRFCSNQCHGKWKSKHRVGENNPTWKGGHSHYYGPNWIRQSHKARKRDEYTCQICGLEQRSPHLCVHHIISLKEFNDNWQEANQLSNLITLCIGCHKRVEWNIIPYPQPKY